MPILFDDPNSKFSPQLLTAIGTGLLSGNTWNEQLANAGLGANTAVAAQQQKQLADAQKNQTIAALQAYPDLANGVSTGALTPALAYGELLKRKQQEQEDAKPKYQVINGKLVQTNAPNGEIKVAADFSDPNANIPAAAKESKYWLTHPDEYTAYQQQRMDAEKAKNQTKPQDQFKTDIETMKTYRGEDAVKTYQATRDAFEKVRTSAQLGTAQGDIGLVYGFMKMLDPTSVVREGEYATAQNSGGISDTVINIYNKVLNGERLTDSQRKQFVEAAGAQYQNTVSNLETTNQRYQSLADQYGVDTGRVLEKPKAYPDLKLGQKINATVNGKPVTIEKINE